MQIPSEVNTEFRLTMLYVEDVFFKKNLEIPSLVGIDIPVKMYTGRLDPSGIINDFKCIAANISFDLRSIRGSSILKYLTANLLSGDNQPKGIGLFNLRYWMLPFIMHCI